MNASEPSYLNLRQAAQYICQLPRYYPSLLRKGVKTLRIPVNIGPKKPCPLERAVPGAYTDKAISGQLSDLFSFVLK